MLRLPPWHFDLEKKEIEGEKHKFPRLVELGFVTCRVAVTSVEVSGCLI